MQSNEAAPQLDYFRWEITGRPIVVKLGMGFVDRLLPEVMRGFGAMPRRGVEMGGILLGSIDRSGDRIDSKLKCYARACLYRCQSGRDMALHGG